ncbi:hemolysin family protein [Granulicella cerasi]|uniref:Hemolysin family protein n=1 Tax=Granulicella cerasi TaxID=741063 RepID=A0ABW1ZER9_9BACT|nr:hemolysin family protein [Granulicella cerasi]
MLVHGSLIAFFILANSFFVAAEFALISVRETRIEQMIAQNRPGARTVLALKHNIDEFLPAVQFGVTLASLALGGLGEPAIADALVAVMHRWGFASHHTLLYAHSLAAVVAFAIITYFEVLLGELVPKSLALQRAERIALAVAGPMEVFIRMTRPAVKVMNASAAGVLKIFRAPLQGESAAHSPEELKLMASASRRSGQLPEVQEAMIHRAIELNHVAVSEIMTPRGKIFSLPADMPLEAASSRMVDEQHSRVPVYDPTEGRDHIIGIVHEKDVARLMHFRALAGTRSASGMTLRQVMREALVVPETKLAVEMLEEFRERRRQMAIVVDEFGSTLGLVTAEDVLEQIVGELEDEFDVGRQLSPLPEGATIDLEGSVSLRDLVTQLRWKLPRAAGVETVAGLILMQLGHIPEVGESAVAEGRRFIVTEMDGNRIAHVRVVPVAQPVDEANATEEVVAE